MKVTICRKEHFNAAHRLYNRNWSDMQNEEVFGKCSYPNYHGHNYELVVKVSGEIDRQTGFVMDTKMLKDLIRKQIIEKFDHRNLNTDVAEFENLNPTAENISVVIWNLLRPDIDKSYELSIVLYETERNFVEYSGK
jgi:6-pyruvoyltetrahydropterin/6-carboxytetrahydropterin synthase